MSSIFNFVIDVFISPGFSGGYAVCACWGKKEVLWLPIVWVCFLEVPTIELQNNR